MKNAIVLSRAAQTDVFQLLELVEVSDSSHEGSNQGGAYFVAAISRQTCNKTSNTIYRFSLVQANFLNVFKKLKAKKTLPPKKLKAIFHCKTKCIGNLSQTIVILVLYLNSCEQYASLRWTYVYTRCCTI